MPARAQQRVLARQVDLVAHARRGGGEVAHIYGLGEEVFGAELHGAHRGLDVTLSREQDDRAAQGPEPLEHLQPPDVGEVQVEDHDVGAHAIECLEPRLGGSGAPHFVANLVEVVPHGAQHVGVVVDQEDAVSHGATRRAAPWRDRR